MKNRKLERRVERIGLFLSICLAVVAIALVSIYFLSNSRRFQFFGNLTARVETEEKVVALTFDDGPSAATEEILAILGQRQVKGTFYVIGQNIEQYPLQTRALVEAGMELGNHSYSHPRFIGKSQAFIDSELQRTNQLIRATGYTGEITFRPPFGKKLLGLPWYLKQHDIQTIMWDVEPDTYAELDADDNRRAAILVEYTLANVKPGSIILLHPFWGYGTADRLALGKMIDDLHERGYRLATVSELLALE